MMFRQRCEWQADNPIKSEEIKFTAQKTGRAVGISTTPNSYTGLQGSRTKSVGINSKTFEKEERGGGEKKRRRRSTGAIAENNIAHKNK